MESEMKTKKKDASGPTEEIHDGKGTDEPTQWVRRLGHNMHYNIKLLKSMKIVIDMFVKSKAGTKYRWSEWLSDSFEGNKDVAKQQEEEDDEAIEDDNFASYQGNFESAFAFARQPKEGPIFQKPSDLS
ncbi:hypothetical protein PVK06_043289 [Gossypium arboreum]|uniref:Uncharacterized protein n=1 Tax=Gossypium arboreum TaxID=29729 RepID=A0ABR0MN42_GOSAR|nr:hypothetical protein PVK06_043289 [Gossypium arboreum]